jgi:hypothetical protein
MVYHEYMPKLINPEILLPTPGNTLDFRGGISVTETNHLNTIILRQHANLQDKFPSFIRVYSLDEIVSKNLEEISSRALTLSINPGLQDQIGMLVNQIIEGCEKNLYRGVTLRDYSYEFSMLDPNKLTELALNVGSVQNQSSRSTIRDFLKSFLPFL